MQDKKLFIWNHDGVLCDYTDGIIFAFADSVDVAREAIIQKAHNAFDNTEFPENIDRIKKEIERDPKIISDTEGFFLFGGG
jgi:phosphoglycolate phosphatase-like HAD superfamily hydrolase